jgi:hypothetical protein
MVPRVSLADNDLIESTLLDWLAGVDQTKARKRKSRRIKATEIYIILRWIGKYSCWLKCLFLSQRAYTY